MQHCTENRDQQSTPKDNQLNPCQEVIGKATGTYVIERMETATVTIETDTHWNMHQEIHGVADT